MWLTILTNVLTILPGLVTSVVGAVQAVEGPGNGAAKKAAVLDTVGASYDHATRLAQVEGQLQPDLSKDVVLDLAGDLTEVAVELLHVRQRAAQERV